MHCNFECNIVLVSIRRDTSMLSEAAGVVSEGLSVM